MQKKASENEFKDFCKRRGYAWHKFADILMCPACFNTIWQSNRMPDFEVTYRGLKTLAEVKQGSGEYGAWNFSSENSGIRPIQREALDAWLETQGVMPWIFLVLGEGRAPKGRGAFLIPWGDWKRIEQGLLAKGQHAIRLEGGRKESAVDTLFRYRLDWCTSTDAHPSGWDLSWGHPFFQFEHVANLSYQLRLEWDLIAGHQKHATLAVMA